MEQRGHEGATENEATQGDPQTAQAPVSEPASAPQGDGDSGEREEVAQGRD